MTISSHTGDTVARPQKAPLLSPMNRRRLANFRANRRGYWSFWIFLVVFGLSLFAEFIANDRPIVLSYKGDLYYPIFTDYPETTFGGFLPRTDYRDPVTIKEITDHGWEIWPPVRYSYNTVNNEIPDPAPAKPSWLYERDKRCGHYELGADDPSCTLGNWNWLGTDDQTRDVLARMIYGFRISVLFGLILTVISSVVGVAAGAVQGYFGGWTDLLFQRFIEIWTSLPELYLLLIVAAILPPGFWILLAILLLFSWTRLVGVVRAEFLRARNFEYVRAARALGVSNTTIMWRHLLPNAMVATLTFMPFILNGSISTLTALDFLGFGLPPPTPSWGELLHQGTANLDAPWIVASTFAALVIVLSLVTFIGESIREAFDAKKFTIYE